MFTYSSRTVLCEHMAIANVCGGVAASMVQHRLRPIEFDEILKEVVQLTQTVLASFDSPDRLISTL